MEDEMVLVEEFSEVTGDESKMMITVDELLRRIDKWEAQRLEDWLDLWGLPEYPLN